MKKTIYYILMAITLLTFVHHFALIIAMFICEGMGCLEVYKNGFYAQMNFDVILWIVGFLSACIGGKLLK